MKVSNYVGMVPVDGVYAYFFPTRAREQKVDGYIPYFRERVLALTLTEHGEVEYVTHSRRAKVEPDPLNGRKMFAFLHDEKAQGPLTEEQIQSNLRGEINRA